MLKIIDKPWGRERILEANDKYAFKILEVDPGKRLSLQYHERKHETMYCLYGRGKLVVDSNVIDLVPGVHVTILPTQVHRLVADDNSPVVIMEASSPELDDVVRLEDDYNRDDDDFNFHPTYDYN